MDPFPNLLVGPVLVGTCSKQCIQLLITFQINRNPTGLPSDVQLVTAVDKHHETFQNYKNVIICSVRGEVSFASKLAGGGNTFFDYILISLSNKKYRL